MEKDFDASIVLQRISGLEARVQELEAFASANEHLPAAEESTRQWRAKRLRTIFRRFYSWMSRTGAAQAMASTWRGIRDDPTAYTSTEEVQAWQQMIDAKCEPLSPRSIVDYLDRSLDR